MILKKPAKAQKELARAQSQAIQSWNQINRAKLPSHKSSRWPLPLLKYNASCKTTKISEWYFMRKPYPIRARQTPAWPQKHQMQCLIVNKDVRHGSQHSSTEVNTPVFCIPPQDTWISSQDSSHTTFSFPWILLQLPYFSSSWKSDGEHNP